LSLAEAEVLVERAGVAHSAMVAEEAEEVLFLELTNRSLLVRYGL
jgi:hypothetical protein